MTNKERYDLVLRDSTSPQSFKDYAYYFLISTCLQRRVWLGGFDPNVPGQLYPNIYVILVGPAGCGKGRTIGPIADMLKYWRIGDLLTGQIIGYDPEVELTEEIEAKPLLYTSGPQDLSYEQLLRRQAQSIRYCDWTRSRGSTTKPAGTPNKYGSSPMYFLLEELSSLFHKDARRVSKYLLTAYDCNDFERDIISRGKDVLKKPCLSFLAGTTPQDLEDQLDESVIGDGLASRTWFIYEMVEGQRLWGYRPPDANQKAAKAELLQHIKSLAFVYGRCHFSPEADAYLKHWWEVESLDNRPNNSPKLDTYYKRKIIHVSKLAMILNFSEQTTNYEISLECAQRALEILAQAERKMHYALNFKGRNPIAPAASKALAFMFEYRKPVTLEYILAADGGGLYNDVNEMEAKEMMRHLMASERVYMPKPGFYFPSKLKGRENIVILGNGKGNTTTSDIPGSELKALPLDKSLL